MHQNPLRRRRQGRALIRSVSVLLLRLAVLAVLSLPLAAFAVPTDIILVLDNSGSMKKNDPEFLLKSAVSRFVTDLGADSQVGMVIFDQGVNYPVALAGLDATSRGAIKAALDGIDYRGQLTDSPAAIERAIYELKNNKREDAQSVIVFMTDGIVDTGDPEVDKEKTKWLREELAADAADNDIRMFAIAFTENADFFLIQTLAKKTDGEYFRALTPEDLSGVFTAINDKLTAPPEPVAPEVPAMPPAAAGSCLATLVPEERAAMEEAAPEAGMTAEQLCQQMMAPASAPPVMVEPVGAPPMVHEEESASIVFLVVIAVVVLALVAVIVVLLRRRGGDGAAAAGAPEPPPVPEAFLKDINNVTGDPSVKIGTKPLMIGRVAGSDPEHLDYYVVDKGTVGRRHALIEYRHFSFWLNDQGSVNGTFLNGERIENERQLKHGDHIRFHKYEFEFSMPEMDDAGHTVFADAADATLIADATMAASAEDLQSDAPITAAPMPAATSDADIFDLDETAEGDIPVVSAEPIAEPDADDDLFDEDETALSARSLAEADDGAAANNDIDPLSATASTADDAFPEYDDDAATTAEEEFDAEASAFFDSDTLGGGGGPPAAMEDDFDEAPTELPAGMPSAPPPAGDEEEGEFSESATLLPGQVYVDDNDNLEGTSDISLDEFMRTDSFETPLAEIDGDDESEDATLLPSQVPESGQRGHTAPNIDEVFDITGDRTVPPAPPGVVDDDLDDDLDDDDSEAPTKFV